MSVAVSTTGRVGPGSWDMGHVPPSTSGSPPVVRDTGLFFTLSVQSQSTLEDTDPPPAPGYRVPVTGLRPVEVLGPSRRRRGQMESVKEGGVRVEFSRVWAGCRGRGVMNSSVGSRDRDA